MPLILLGVGAVGSLLGAFLNLKQFGFSWLLSFMFFLSLCLGGLFLTLVHHLFDAAWSVPIRRLTEHLACLAPVLAALFIPIAILAPKLPIYQWMVNDPHHDHALSSKLPLFTLPMFYLLAALCFAIWTFFSWRLRHWSKVQDQTGAPECSSRMLRLSCMGIWCLALTLTLAAIMWMKALQHQWFSTMYGVYYFASCTWTTLATIYVIALVLKRMGPLAIVMGEKQFYFLGSLFFAFTVFYAYISFAQYFIIWNANIPEETFWYVLREKGTWFDIALIIIFGHFGLPFVGLLRIDVKLMPVVMIPVGIWAWMMNWCDLAFNIMPVLHPEGFILHWIDISTFLFMLGLLSQVFVIYFKSAAPYPIRDPRLAEGLDIYVPATTDIAVAPSERKH